jgi:hypothetical protein
MPAKDRISLTIDPDILARIDKVATARGESRSATAERILRNGVEDEEEMLGSLGQGIEGRIIAHLLKSPRTLRKLAEVVGAELTEDKLARIEAEGPEIVKAGQRYRSTTPTKQRKNP